MVSPAGCSLDFVRSSSTELDLESRYADREVPRCYPKNRLALGLLNDATDSCSANRSRSGEIVASEATACG